MMSEAFFTLSQLRRSNRKINLFARQIGPTIKAADNREDMIAHRGLPRTAYTQELYL
jgi:hypothetical protein